MSNWYTTLRAAFPADLDTVAIEAIDAPQPAVYTWRDLDCGASRIAALFERLALTPGSRVAVQVDKSVEALMLYLATLRAGLVVVPLNSAYRSAEMAYFLDDCAPAVLVCAPAQFGALSTLAFQRGVGHVFTLGEDRSGTLLERAAFERDDHAPVAVAGDALAALVYTSGTTGRSKGAMLSHDALRANAQALLAHWDWRTGDVLLHALPIFHVHGLFVAVHCALLGASRMLWCHRFETDTVLPALPRASVFMGVPTMYTRLLADARLTRERCAAMRLFVSGSAPLLASTFEAFTARTGHTILERYGMSETLMITSNPCRPEDGVRQAGTVGRALPGVQVRVVGSAAATLPAGETGAVQVRGPSVCQGYWQMPEKTAEAFTADGWFDTGDVGVLDEAGVLTLVGRSKDLIITGGYNVYPAEVEGWLNALPGVAESAAIGVPHPDFGEAVLAVVVAQPGAQLAPAALLAALKTQVASFKVPKHVAVLPELPRNAMGKVQKALLREQFAGTFAGASTRS